MSSATASTFVNLSPPPLLIDSLRLQGFPDHFVIETERTNAHRFYHQIGNAVVPPVVELVARAMMLALRPSVSSSEL